MKQRRPAHQVLIVCATQTCILLYTRINLEGVTYRGAPSRATQAASNARKGSAQGAGYHRRTRNDVIGRAPGLLNLPRRTAEAATMATVGRRLEGRVVIVTASTDGIGTALTQICPPRRPSGGAGLTWPALVPPPAHRTRRPGHCRAGGAGRRHGRDLVPQAGQRGPRRGRDPRPWAQSGGHPGAHGQGRGHPAAHRRDGPPPRPDRRPRVERGRLAGHGPAHDAHRGRVGQDLFGQPQGVVAAGQGGRAAPRAQRVGAPGGVDRGVCADVPARRVRREQNRAARPHQGARAGAGPVRRARQLPRAGPDQDPLQRGALEERRDQQPHGRQLVPRPHRHRRRDGR